MKRIIQICLILGLLVGIGFYFSRMFIPTVFVAAAVTGKAVNAVTGTLEVFAHMDIEVKALHRGVLLAPPVFPGQRVKTGDVLARQASEELDLRIEQVQIRLDAARARGDLESRAKIDLETLREQLTGVEVAVRLGQTPGTRLNDLKREERKLAVNFGLEQINDREQLRLLENQLEQLVLQKDQMTTLAPFDGTVAVLKAFEGDLVNGGQSLVRLVSQGRFVMMELTEEDYFGVRDGQRVTLRLASYPDRAFEGHVSRLEDIANAENKTRNVIVNVDANEAELVPGLSGEGFLVKGERDDAVLIPRRALLGNVVFVVVDGRVEQRTVQAGFVGLNQAEIVSGIEAGELIVLEDQNLLRPGDKVKVERR